MDGFIKIYRVVNGATEELKEVTLSKRSYWHHELGGIDYVMLFFSLDSDNLAVTTPFKEGDFIINPINGDKYFIMDLAVPNENNSGFWDFQLRFDSIVTALSRNICKYTLQEGITELSWKLTDSFDKNSVLRRAILGSLTHDDITQSGNWVIDAESFAADIDFSEQFTYSLDGEKYTALFDKICENYGCEWWNVKRGNDNIVYFGIAKTGEGSEIEFVDTETNEQAHQLQIISTSTQKSGEDYATKLYYRGSERNVPRNYDLTTGVKRAPVSYLNDSRLPLPDNTPFIASSDFEDKPHACIELYETNDKIYPRRLEYVTQVLYYKGKNDEGDEQRFYCVKTDNPVAALADFKVDAQKGNLSIAFSSGSLNGRTYEVQLHKTSLSRATVYNLDGTPFEGNKSGCWYEIISEGGDNYTPNEFLYPAVGDECQLFNWVAYDTTTKQLTPAMLQLIADARKELYAEAQERFKEICVLNTSFTCVPAKVGTPSSMLLNIGQSVKVNTAPVLVGSSFISRIRAIEVMLYNTNDRTYTVGIGAKYSRLGRIINSLRENREDLKNVEEEVNTQTNPTTYVIREKRGFQAVRLKQDGTFIPNTLSFEVFGITGRTEVNCTDRSSIRVKFDNGAWISPDEEGNFQVSGNFQTITASAFTDESLEVLRASMTLHKIEDGSRAASLVITNPLQIIEVNEDWDVGYAFADDTDSYETDIYCFSKGGNLPMTDIDIFLEATNGSKVAIVTDGVAVGNTTINGAPIRVSFIVQDNKAHLSVAFTNASVEQLFTIPVLVGITALVDGATSEISQTANIVFRQKGVDGTDGTDGSAASVRKLIISPDYIVSDAEGNILSRQITFSGQISVGDGLPTVLPDVKFKAIIDGSTVSTNITSPYTLPESCKTVLIEMYDETGLTLLDSQSIPIIQQGGVGKDAVTIILSNENHTLSLEDDRGVINYSGSGTSVKLVTAAYEFVPKDYSTYPEDERWKHLQPGEFFVHAAGTDITAGTRSILGNSFVFGNASNIVGGTTGNRSAYIDFTIYFRAIGETQINYVTKRQNFSVAPSGFNVAIITLYKRSAEELASDDFTAACAAATPDAITAIRYNFITKAISTLPAGWTSTMPSTKEAALWAVQATARSRTDEDSIAVTEFSSPTKVLPSGLNTVLTAHSSTTYNSTSNQLALTIVDEDGSHTIQNGFGNSSTRPGSATTGALKVFELDPSTLNVISTKIINIYTEYAIDEINTYLSSISNDSIVAVCAYGNVVQMFSKYTGANGLGNFLGTLGCPRFRLNSGETFAFIGGKFVTPGAGILAISTGSVDASVFIDDGVFVNGQTQLKSETVTLYGRFINKDAAMASYSIIGTLTYNFNTHSLTSSLTEWSQDFPEAGSKNYPCFMIQATASNVNDIDEILGSEWSSPVEYVKNGESAPNFVWSSAYIQVNLDKNNYLLNDTVNEVMEAYIGASLKNVNSVLRLEVDGIPTWSTSGWDLDAASSLGVEYDTAPLWISGGRMYLGFTFKPTITEEPGTVKTITCYFTILDNNGIVKTYSSSIKLKFDTGNYPGENATKLELIANKTSNLPFLASAGSGNYTNLYTSTSYADPTGYTFYADYTGYNFCVKRYNGENHALLDSFDGITVQIVGNFTTRTVDTKYNSEPSSPDKRTNYMYLQDGNLYVHVGAIPGERCVNSNGSYIIFPPSSIGVVVNVGDLSISTVLSVDYTAIWSEVKVANDEISSSVNTLQGEFSHIQQRSNLISLKVGNEKTQQRINLLSNAYINRVFETSSTESDSYEISKVRLEANHWYILSAEAFESDTRKQLAVYLNLSTRYVAYCNSKQINGSNIAAAVQGFSNVLFERKAALFKMGSTTMETNVFGLAPSGYARNCVLKYAQIEDVTDIVNKINPTPHELSKGTIAGATFDEFAAVMASPYSLGPEDYLVNSSLVLYPKCFTVDSTGNSYSTVTEIVTLPNGTKATAYDLTFNNATGKPSASYWKELQALSNPATVLTVGKTYTMSFWAKGSPANVDNAAVYMNAANFFYPAAAPETTLNGVTYKSYGYQAISASWLSVSNLYWKIDSATWKFYQITFTVLKNHPTDYCIFLRNYGGTLKIACPKLELGGRATEFNDNVSIRELLATGVDVTNGKILMTADNFVIRNNLGEQTFYVDSDGYINGYGTSKFKDILADNIKVTNGEFTGKITSNSGTIGPFTISNDGFYAGDISNWATTKKDFCYLHAGALRLSQQVGYFEEGDVANMRVFLGRQSDPYETNSDNYCDSAMYIYRRMNTSTSPYKPAVKVISDNVKNRNIAMQLVGGLQVWGGIIEKGRYMEFSKNGDTNILDLSFGTTFLLRNSSDSYCNFYVPTVTEVRNQLGITSTTEAFAVPITVVCCGNNVNTIYITSQYKSGNVTSDVGGLIRDNNFNEWKSSQVPMEKGDVIRFILVFDGTTYSIQVASQFA